MDVCVLGLCVCVLMGLAGDGNNIYYLFCINTLGDVELTCVALFLFGIIGRCA